ncbi:hypothetical protein KP509_29G040900 [Ceratopteris richardii]|uniref:Uncharacterized protein n=1 Tax=Ceratopteris richardii TaxID=49495 RepID=A0A8T2R8J9_CERRI|nr:hypothetical protein KP509_29G040900 [Ceratopteris richardii]
MMAHLIANNPGQQDAGEILLAGFTDMALRMETQRRLTKPGSKPRRSKKGPKKQPQRGLGVAQLEKIRLEEQRRASEHAQQILALRQLQSASPLLIPASGSMQGAASVIPPLDRERFIQTSSFGIHADPSSKTSSAFHFACADSNGGQAIPNMLSPACRNASSATFLELFPTESSTGASSVNLSGSFLPENPWLHQREASDEGRLHFLHANSLQNSLNPPCGRSNGHAGYSLLHMRHNPSLTADATNTTGSLSQAPFLIASPPISGALDRVMELSSFQTATPSLAAGASSTSVGSDWIFSPKRQVWSAAVLRQGPQREQQQQQELQQQEEEPQRKHLSSHSELTSWATPSLSVSCKSYIDGLGKSCRVGNECELTLRPPGVAATETCEKWTERSRSGLELPSHGLQGSLRNFLSISLCSNWRDGTVDVRSATPTLVSADSTHATTSTTDECTSSMGTSMAGLQNILALRYCQSNKSPVTQFPLYDKELDLTLRL